MKKAIVSGIEDRRKAAADAKMELLKRFKAAPKPDDPVMIAKREERARIVAAREERRKEKEAEKLVLAQKAEEDRKAKDKARERARKRRKGKKRKSKKNSFGVSLDGF